MILTDDDDEEMEDARSHMAAPVDTLWYDVCCFRVYLPMFPPGGIFDTLTIQHNQVSQHQPTSNPVHRGRCHQTRRHP